MERLPFVYKESRVHRSEKSIQWILDFSKKFMREEVVEGFEKWERKDFHRNTSSCLILLPGSSFVKNKQTFRSDIKWMWNLLSNREGRAQCGRAGFLSILFTEEPDLYIPKGNPLVGTWEEAKLMWAWIKYVTNQSWYKQKRGTLRNIFEDIDSVPKMLALVSEKLITGD